MRLRTFWISCCYKEYLDLFESKGAYVLQILSVPLYVESLRMVSRKFIYDANLQKESIIKDFLFFSFSNLLNSCFINS